MRSTVGLLALASYPASYYLEYYDKFGIIGHLPVKDAISASFQPGHINKIIAIKGDQHENTQDSTL
jgi:hypothetical protein